MVSVTAACADTPNTCGFPMAPPGPWLAPAPTGQVGTPGLGGGMGETGCGFPEGRRRVNLGRLLSELGDCKERFIVVTK